MPEKPLATQVALEYYSFLFVQQEMRMGQRVMLAPACMWFKKRLYT